MAGGEVMRRVMIDIETMATHDSRSLLLSCAACCFSTEPSPTSGLVPPAITEEVLWVLDAHEQLLLGRIVDPATQEFWKQQPLAAASHWLDPPEDLERLLQFTEALSTYLSGCDELWANGVVFDIGNLGSLYGAEKVPWKYNAVRDARTVYRVMPVLPERQEALDRYKGDMDANGGAHDPQVDCRWQVWQLWARGL